MEIKEWHLAKAHLFARVSLKSVFFIPQKWIVFIESFFYFFHESRHLSSLKVHLSTDK